MKLFILIVLLLSTDPVQIAKINGLKREANKAFQQGNYEAAAAKYSLLKDSLQVDEDEIALNLAHSYFQLGDTSNAKSNYHAVASSDNKQLQSIASQQLGVLAKNEQKLEESLSYLKNAIKANPQNRDAKYDYEVVKKLLDQQKQNQQNNQNQDQQNDENQDQKDQEQQNQENQQNQDQQNDQNQDKQDQQNQDQKDEQGEEQESKDGEKKDGEQSDEQKQQEGEKSDEQKQQEMDEATRKKLEEMNISEEKAKMILEALKNNEIQYIQQRKRQPTQQPSSDRPDW